MGISATLLKNQEDIRAAEEWARRQGCREMASDTNDYRQVSLKAHQALGYQVTSYGEEILFHKWL